MLLPRKSGPEKGFVRCSDVRGVTWQPAHYSFVGGPVLPYGKAKESSQKV
jgi:hypothetical protein